MNRFERNSPEGEDKQFNLNMLVRLNDDLNMFEFTDRDGDVKRFSISGYFESIKKRLPNDKDIFIKIHVHVLDENELCEVGTFLDNTKVTRIKGT